MSKAPKPTKNKPKPKKKKGKEDPKKTKAKKGKKGRSDIKLDLSVNELSHLRNLMTVAVEMGDLRSISSILAEEYGPLTAGGEHGLYAKVVEACEVMNIPTEDDAPDYVIRSEVTFSLAEISNEPTKQEPFAPLFYFDDEDDNEDEESFEDDEDN